MIQELTQFLLGCLDRGHSTAVVGRPHGLFQRSAALDNDAHRVVERENTSHVRRGHFPHAVPRHGSRLYPQELDGCRQRDLEGEQAGVHLFQAVRGGGRSQRGEHVADGPASEVAHHGITSPEFIGEDWQLVHQLTLHPWPQVGVSGKDKGDQRLFVIEHRVGAAGTFPLVTGQQLQLLQQFVSIGEVHGQAIPQRLAPRRGSQTEIRHCQFRRLAHETRPSPRQSAPGPPLARQSGAAAQSAADFFAAPVPPHAFRPIPARHGRWCPQTQTS